MKAGIYQILCVPNGKFYIGSSCDVQRRFAEHKSHLRSGTHQNQYLQHAWKKYGEENFNFLILQLVESELLIFDLEQDWLDKTKSYDSEIGYNLSKLSCGVDSLRNSKKYIVTTPANEEIVVQNLSKFSRERGIKGGGLHQVAHGAVNQCFGYTCRYFEDTIDDWKKKIQRPSKHGAGYKGKYKIIHPNGTEEIVFSLNAFCQQHNLSQGSLRQTCTGKRKHYKGYIAQFIHIEGDT